MLQKFDERNRDLIVNINGQLVHRDEAGINPFDSAVQGGDAVWEGLRLYDGRIFKFHEHLDRLERSAHALAFAEVPPRENHRGNQAYTRRKQNARRRSYSPYADTRCENHVGYGSPAEPKRADVDCAG